MQEEFEQLKQNGNGIPNNKLYLPNYSLIEILNTSYLRFIVRIITILFSMLLWAGIFYLLAKYLVLSQTLSSLYWTLIGGAVGNLMWYPSAIALLAAYKIYSNWFSQQWRHLGNALFLAVSIPILPTLQLLYALNLLRYLLVKAIHRFRQPATSQAIYPAREDGWYYRYVSQGLQWFGHHKQDTQESKQDRLNRYLYYVGWIPVIGIMLIVGSILMLMLPVSVPIVNKLLLSLLVAYAMWIACVTIVNMFITCFDKDENKSIWQLSNDIRQLLIAIPVTCLKPWQLGFKIFLGPALWCVSFIFTGVKQRQLIINAMSAHPKRYSCMARLCIFVSFDADLSRCFDWVHTLKEAAEKEKVQSGVNLRNVENEVNKVGVYEKMSKAIYYAFTTSTDNYVNDENTLVSAIVRDYKPK